MADIIKRTTPMVRDAERAARWYEQVFGMTRWMDTPFTLSGTQLAAGNKGDRARLVILKCEDDLIGMIGLLEWLDPKQPAPAELTTRIAFGVPIFVVASTDARAAVEKARTLGSRIHSEPRDCVWWHSMKSPASPWRPCRTHAARRSCLRSRTPTL